MATSMLLRRGPAMLARLGRTAGPSSLAAPRCPSCGRLATVGRSGGCGGPGCDCYGKASCAYHQRVIDHMEKPRNVGTLPKDDANVGTGLRGAPECGDVMQLQIRVDPDTNRVRDATFKTFGGGSAIASSSVATEWVKGKTIDEVLKIKNADLAEYLSLPPVKLHCSMLAEDTIRAAVDDYKKKNMVAES